MITKEVRAGREQADIDAARSALDAELATEKVIIVIRGGDEVGDFAGKADGRASPFPWREAVWLKVGDENLRRILTSREYDDWYAGHDDVCAVVLGRSRQVSSRLESSASNFKIDDAFAGA